MTLRRAKKSNGNWSIVLLLLTIVALKPSYGQDRRRLQTPGLVVATQSPVADTLAMTFTADGKHLLAAGLDKVVRSWPVGKNGKLDRDGLREYRWAIHREQGGTINAMALSNDDTRIAVGGFGCPRAAVVVFDRDTGKVLHGLKEPNCDESVSSLCFSPNNKAILCGMLDGAVRRWDLETNELTEVGRHGNAESANTQNRIVTLGFTSGKLVSVAEDGSIRLWHEGKFVETRFSITKLTDAAVSPNGRNIAASGLTNRNLSALEVREFGKAVPTQLLSFPKEYSSEKLAFRDDSSQVFLGINVFATALPTGYLYRRDLKKNKGKFFPVAAPISEIACSSESHLAAIGGINRELKIIGSTFFAPLDVLTSQGTAKWQVGLSADRKYVGYQDKQNGDWKVFQLPSRRWANAEETKAFKPHTVANDAWNLRPVAGKPSSAKLVTPTKRVFELNINGKQYDRIRSFRFLPPIGIKPNRLIIGHEWGATLFHVYSDVPPKRIREYVGHQGAVLSISFSEDQSIFVTGGDDKTVSFWSLADWPNHGELGASFEKRGTELVAKNVAPGSPAWEAGLTPGDHVENLQLKAERIPPERWEEVLRAPPPGSELLMRCRRRGRKDAQIIRTTTRQRPLWRFFAHKEEWVLWRWRDYFYDSSLAGDQLIGWQLSSDIDKTPIFVRAEQYRERFYKPNKIEEVFKNLVVAPEKVAIPELVPPQVEVSIAKLDSGDYEVEIDARPRDLDVTTSEPVEISLWVNEHKFKTWPNPQGNFSRKQVIKLADLRSGTNRIGVDAYSTYGVRSDEIEETVNKAAREAKPVLFGLCVGIDKYGGQWPNLTFAEIDAKSIHETLLRQAAFPDYSKVECQLLANQDDQQKASRARIIQELKNVAEVAKPDDLFVFFLAGHAWGRRQAVESFDPETFTFVTPAFDKSDPYTTGLPFTQAINTPEVRSTDTLFELLSRIACRKLVLLDCCHAGGSTEAVRILTPNASIGPTILVACGPGENSWELIPEAHGAFTAAILDAVSTHGFPIANRDGDVRLDATELTSFVQKKVPSFIDENRNALEARGLGRGQSQHPQAFLPADALRIEWFRP